MGEIIKTYGPADDDWAKPREDQPADDYTPEQGRADWLNATRCLGEITETSRALDRYLLKGARERVESLNAAHLVGAAAMIQDLRRALGQTEAWLAREAGRALAEVEGLAGELPDGRTYKVSKAADRKAWDHPAWQADVRRQVMSGLEDHQVVDTETGEAVDVYALLAAVQAVHGATNPKVGALKGLGLNAGDYCETVPGSWSVRVFQPGADTATMED